MTDERQQKLRRELKEKQLDALLISQPENRHYLSGFTGTAGWLLVTACKAVLATDFRYIEQAGIQASDYEIFRIAGGIADWFPGLVNDLNIKSLGFEAEHVSFVLHHQMKNTLNKNKFPVKLVPSTGLVESLRAVKEPEEIEFIRRASRLSDAAFEHVAGTFQAGMTEIQIAWELEKYIREHGSQALPFEIIVASGPNSALPHAHPSERAVKPGEPVVIDMGARYAGYASDLTRTICAGNPDDTFKKIYHTVLDAQQAAMAIIKEGATGHEVDRAARQVIEKAGYGKNFGHGLGHGVGLAAHEAPRLGPGLKNTLETGMVFTVEPGIYVTGWGGVRIEDMVTITRGKADSISKARKVRYD